MDYNHDNGCDEKWMWQDGLYCHEQNSSCDVSPCTQNEVLVNQQDLSYMLSETTTPVEACGDLAYHVNHRGDSNKEPEELVESSSHLKRRRMLQFDTEAVNSPFCDEELDFLLQESGTDDSLEEVLPLVSQWSVGFPNMSASSYDGPNQQSDGWLAECLNDTEMHMSSDAMNLSEVSNIQIDVSEFCSDAPTSDANVVQKRVTRTPQNVIFKGRKSTIRIPTKVPSSIAYPFAFIKPCSFQGDITLNDINQWISTPNPVKSKQNDEEPVAYPTSAFSGKPVVGKTKIRTEGGKGSITIMRTKG